MKAKVFLLSMLLTVLVNFSDAQIIYTIAGTGVAGYNGDGISSSSAQLSFPTAVAVDTAGNVYVSDQVNFRIRKITPSGVITTIAGTGVSGYSGDGGIATSAKITGAYDVWVDRYGNVYIGDNGNNRIRKVNTAGIITTIAGTGAAGFSGDGGLATAAQLNNPTGVAVDTLGNVYIGDANNNRIRKINTSGIISTIGGTGVAGSGGDGGLATAAQFNANGKMSFDKFGNLYIADNGSRKVRKINLAGIVTTVAGTGSGGSTGDGGLATAATFTYPFGISVDTAGNIFIDDYTNKRVRKVNSSGIISTYAGTGVAGYSGDGGLATLAKLNPQASTSDKYGNLLIADLGNHCIRKIVATCTAPSPPTSSTASLNGCSGQTKTLSVLSPGLIKWYAFPTGGTALGTGFNYTTPVLTADTTFYAETTTCSTSATRTAFPITINPLPSVTSSNDTTVCSGSAVTLYGGGASTYTWTGGITNGVSFSASATITYTVTGTSAAGCTGTTTTIVIVNPADPSFTASGAVLTANVTGATAYQWYNCTTSSSIGGATSQSYTIPTGGTYALIINQTGCVDTSACQSITVTGIDNAILNELNIFPNPFSSIVTIIGVDKDAIVEVYNLIGEKLFSLLLTDNQLDLTSLSKGMYLIHVQTENGVISKKIVKE